MSDFAEALGKSAENVRKPRPQHPKGWEPHVEERGDGTATAVSQPVEDANPEHDWLIAGWGLDPVEWRIVGRVNCRRWQTYDERWLHYYKADLERRDRSHLDIDALVARVLKRKPRRPHEHGAYVGSALVVGWADWQVGKGDGSATPDQAIRDTKDRLCNMIGGVEDRIRDLRKMGVPITGIYPLGLGDLGEACGGHYAQQGFRTVLNVRDQREVVRWAIDSALDSWSRKVDWIAVKAVGGNHGEEREGGKSYTDFADNRDVAVFSDVRFAYSKNPDRYGHVSFALPNDDLTLTFEHDGLVIGIAHGHQAGYATGGADPRAKIHNWWKGQMDGQQDIGDADILVTGHYHHPWMVRRGSRTHFGCPALDGGSDWWRHTAGQVAPPGTLTFVVGHGRWQSMEIV